MAKSKLRTALKKELALGARKLTPSQRLKLASALVTDARRLFVAGLMHQGFPEQQAYALWAASSQKDERRLPPAR